MVRVKICGITRKEDALAAMEAGAHALGLVFYPKSPRYVEPQRARDLVGGLPPLVSWVGVFVDVPVEEMITTARMVGLDTLQLHGDESPQVCRTCREEGFRVIKALRLASRDDLKAGEDYRGVISALLLDTKVSGEYGGTGRSFPWELATEIRGIPVILAGGLNPENVAEAIKVARPWGVDVSSGVERAPGIKDHEKMRRFILEVQGSTFKVLCSRNLEFRT